MIMDLKDIKVDYHRNGVGGQPFYVCTFIHTEYGKDLNMVAILFDDQSYCAVLDVDLLSKGDIAFGSNSWRGDMYESELRDAIKLWTKEENKKYGITEDE